MREGLYSTPVAAVDPGSHCHGFRQCDRAIGREGLLAAADHQPQLIGRSDAVGIPGVGGDVGKQPGVIGAVPLKIPHAAFGGIGRPR